MEGQFVSAKEGQIIIIIIIITVYERTVAKMTSKSKVASQLKYGCLYPQFRYSPFILNANICLHYYYGNMCATVWQPDGPFG